jgi:hypothetical protein
MSVAVLQNLSHSRAGTRAAGVEVTGYPMAEGFAEIACFV